MRNNGLWLVPMVLVALSGVRLCAVEHKHDGMIAPHGGQMLVVGEEIAHIEIVLDEKAGKLTLYVFDKDGKTPLALKDAPRINLKAADGNKQLETKPIESKDGLAAQFEVVDGALKAHPLNARIAIAIGELKYNIKMDDGHGH